MDAAYLSAFSALAGSAIGASASFASTWLTQHSQSRAQHRSQMRARREALYGDFIEEAARLFADASNHDLDDLSKMTHLYGIVGKIRLFASQDVIDQAEIVMREAVAAYQRPSLQAREIAEMMLQQPEDPLRAFSLSCRRDLNL